VTLEHVTIEKTLEEIMKDINKQVLETKYTLNLRQLLSIIPYINWYIFNSVPSKPVLSKLVVASITIDH
jgi:hypothetical protein